MGPEKSELSAVYARYRDWVMDIWQRNFVCLSISINKIDLRCNIFLFNQNNYWKSIESIQLIKHTADGDNDFLSDGESEAFGTLVNWIKLDNCH